MISTRQMVDSMEAFYREFPIDSIDTRQTYIFKNKKFIIRADPYSGREMHFYAHFNGIDDASGESISFFMDI